MNRVALNVLAKAATDAIRTESLNGVEYMVVPVVALVEGVLTGANAGQPELALAEEFGRHPQGWNGRPVVMGHPMVDGAYVSANSPEILTEWAIGTLFNTYMDGKKLKTEAWIDLSKVSALGGEAQATVDRINDGEMVEVSTGLFTGTLSVQGEYEGEGYAAVWSGVVPDHLALLPEGTIGACSVEMGCGTPRLNMRANASIRMAPSMLRSAEEDASGPAHGGCGCGCGGHCGNNGGHEVNANAEGDHTHPVTRSLEERLQKAEFRFAEMTVNSYPTDMPSDNVHKLLRSAMGRDMYYLYTFTQDKVIYERWDSSKTYQRSYTISDDGATVTLGDDEEEVNLLTKVVPVVPATAALNVNSQEPNDMAGEQSTQTQSVAPTDPAPNLPEADPNKQNPNPDTTADDPARTSVPMGTSADGTLTPPADPSQPPANAQATPLNPETAPVSDTPNANSAPAQPRVQTAAEYIAQAPAELQEVLGESLRLHSQQKTKLVEALKANANCDYTEDELKGMSLKDLQRLSKLSGADAPVDYSGQSGPRAHTAPASEQFTPVSVHAFPRPGEQKKDTNAA